MVALRAMEPLQIKQAALIAKELLKLAVDNDTESKKIIAEFLDRKIQKEKVEKYRPFILLVIVLVICLLIWLMGH